MTGKKAVPNEKRRDAQAHRQILEATVALMEEVGYKKLSIEAVAARAGVGKQTIYRWWKGKAELVVEAYTRSTATQAADTLPAIDTGSLTGDLRELLLSIFRQNAEYDRGAALASKSMMAEAQLDRAFLVTYRDLVQSWHAYFREVLERGQTRGELRADADMDALVDLIMGASWYRLLLEHAPVDEAYADAIAFTVVNGNRAMPD